MLSSDVLFSGRLIGGCFIKKKVETSHKPKSEPTTNTIIKPVKLSIRSIKRPTISADAEPDMVLTSILLLKKRPIISAGTNDPIQELKAIEVTELATDEMVISTVIDQMIA